MKNRERAVRDGAGDDVFSRLDSRPKASASGLFRQIEEMAKTAGFSYYLLADFPRGDRSGFLANCLASNWPKNLIAFYEEADLFYCSKLITQLKRQITPVFCDNAPFEGAAANQENHSLTTLFRMHGLKNTFAFALHDANLRQYVFAFSGERTALPRDEVKEQVFRGMEFLDAFSRLNPVEQPSEALSSREIECLRWSAAGKSSDEIAIILDLSPHTVAGYLKSAMRKLDSVNRMQAVARAFRYRLL
ncbi:LuxR C-terminal-related transcriptional regulator [Rhizobium sp. Root1220]|uniref:helix-turn-helix transcriptional regulator n=1 Tax=Rhizobium sp. Root1220 TaxID=1736432 RepID=UPI0006F69539|nr:LuxR C-terminal-related transcriptional regulator [Rhizobium sp. Root1220]KQV83759.1 DNA-binding protein [Rhizobium sp. Root1220]